MKNNSRSYKRNLEIFESGVNKMKKYMYLQLAMESCLQPLDIHNLQSHYHQGHTLPALCSAEN